MDTPQPSSSPSRVDASDGDGVTVEHEGTTTIAETVVAKIAGIAARAVAGVYALGGGGARMVGAIREAVTTTDLAQGVSVTVDHMQATVGVVMVVEYPTPAHQVADAVRAAITEAVSTLVGMHVQAVNINVNDIHVQSTEPDDDQANRT